MLPLCVLAARPVAAQQWSADVYAGGTRYSALESNVGAANVVGNLRVEASRLFAYLSAAAPLENGAPVWGALGGGMRLSRAVQHGVRIGLELNGDAYAFRHPGSSIGTGVTTHVLPYLAVTRGAFALQLRGGRHDHHMDAAQGPSSRYLYETGARATAGDNDRFAIGDMRFLAAAGQSYPMGRVQLGARIRAARVWGMAGRWFGDDLSETVWGTGASVDVGTRGELWANVRRDAADPLYMNLARTSWNIGYSMRLGRSPHAMPAPEVRGGMLVVRLPRRAAGGAVAPAIAGEFSDWRPLPMHAADDEWLIEIPVRPGVYRFAFVAATGDWFVPENFPGRMDDDMGGHVAVVLVQ